MRAYANCGGWQHRARNGPSGASAKNLSLSRARLSDLSQTLIPHMASDWIGGLPADIMGMILCRLPVADYIRSSAVCSSWRQVTTEYPHLPVTPEIPYLLLPCTGAGGDGNEDLSNLFSLADQKVYHLPHICGRRCLGSSDGWIVTIDELAELHLLNPFTGAEASVPSITTFSLIEGVERDLSQSKTALVC